MVPQTWTHQVESSCVNILRTTTTKTQPVKFFIFMSINKHGQKNSKQFRGRGQENEML